ncbi:LysM-domain-containing protein [Lizonia empirigonia]|nr:LysM-domain-containing protein [Lizonia empirigonia]
MKTSSAALFFSVLISTAIAKPVHSHSSGTHSRESCNTTTTYVVKQGDTLSAIAAQYGVGFCDIAKANSISDPNFISIGEKLIIPEPTGTKDNTSCLKTPAPLVCVTTDPCTYVVKSGDTLTTLAASAGVGICDIAKTNNIADPNLIYVGETLVIPKATGTKDDTSCMNTKPSLACVTTDPCTYVVKSGDTLTTIAASAGVGICDIAKSNNIANPNLIYVGETLVIPKATGTKDNTSCMATPSPSADSTKPTASPTA